MNNIFLPGENPPADTPARFEAIPASRAELRNAIFNCAYEFIGLLQPDGTVLDANPSSLDFVGATLAEVEGHPFWETPCWSWDAEGRAKLQAGIAAAARGEFVRFEARHHNASGEEITVDFSLKPIMDEHGAVVLLVPEGRDITERKGVEYALRRAHDELEKKVEERTASLAQANEALQAEIAARKQAETTLQANEARMAGIIDLAMDAIILVDGQHRIVLFNAVAEKMFGFSSEEMIGQPLSRLLPESFHATLDEHIRRFGETGVTVRAMGTLTAVSGLRRDGDVFPIEASISQIEAGGEKLFTVILRDITARRLAAEQLNEQAALLNHAREAIAAVDTTGHLLFWNHGAEQLYGWKTEEVIGRNIDAQVFHEKLTQRDEAHRVLFEKGEWTGELHQFTKDGRDITVESHCTLVRDPDGRHKSTLVINTDITEKKKLEQQFLRAQRMENLGTLAGGIAHDLNNLLSPITMGVQMLQMKHSDEFSQKMLGVMAANAERGAAMIKQILSFARGAGGERIPLQPQHLVKEVVKMMRETFPKEIEIKQQLGEDLWPVEGDPTELHQVLMNLCVNARDAMPRGGILSIRIENQTIDELSARMWTQAKAGHYVKITVADTGDGIPVEHLERIFEPFFTTKELGKGTGLGLATVHGIVKAHGGFINVYSEVGRGTQFNIYLPAQAGLRAAKAEAAPRDTPVGDGELILVVDDEASIREMTRSALEAFGYRVLAAGDGAEAVSLYAQHPDEVQLVLTDMMMPVMDGPAMIRALQRINPRVAVIGSSGLAESGKADEAQQLGVERILSKPYNAETLLKTVAQAIRKNE